MKLHKVARTFRRIALLTALTGGMAFQTQSCTPQVRTAFLVGMQETFNAFVTTLLDTFFLVLVTSQTPTTQTMDTVI